MQHAPTRRSWVLVLSALAIGCLDGQGLVAEVTVAGESVGRIGTGILALIAVERGEVIALYALQDFSSCQSVITFDVDAAALTAAVRISCAG